MLKLKSIYTTIFIVIAFLLLITQGCVSSIHPLYEEDQYVQDDRLLGTWQRNGEYWVFERYNAIDYSLTHYATGEPSRFIARLLNLNGVYYIDIYPHSEVESNYLKEIHFVPTHTFSVLKVYGNQLIITLADKGLVRQAIDRGSVKLDYILAPDEKLILTSPTRVLQQFVAQNNYVFSEQVVLTKHKEAKADLSEGFEGFFESTPDDDFEEEFETQPDKDERFEYNVTE